MHRRGTMALQAALLMSTTGCVRSIWFTQPLRETYEIGVVSSPMGGDALADPAFIPPEEPETTTPSPDPAAESAPESESADPIAPREPPARSPDELQYFVSERLVLERAVTSRDGVVAQGRIKVRRGRFVEQVVIPRKTPGVAVDWGDDWVAVSFEADSALVFALDARDGTPNNAEIYHLRTRRDPSGGSTWVTMRGEQYALQRGHHARLQVRRDSQTKRSRRRRVIRGRTLE